MADSDFSVADSLQDILFGSLSGCTGKTIEYPFDTVKVRLQSQPHDQPPKFAGAWDCIRKTFQKEGIVGFYRGISSPIVGAAAENATLFVSYNIAQTAIKKHVLQTKDDLTIPYLVLCGGISGLVASYVLTPIELIKCKMQVESLYSNKTSSITQLCRAVWRTGGLAGFWHGQTGTLLRECGGSAAWFGVYEFVSFELKKLRLKRTPTSKDTNSVPELLISGASAGVGYNLSLFPADTIKSKMQTSSIINPEAHLTFISAAKDLYRHGGISIFYRGLGITLIRAIPSNAVIFFTYEELKKIFA
ncbi:Ort1p [Cyberlindnera jadinii NRRL Y-1542]|uniref:Mitochondrial carrier n=1 Tax=Cyberlindnera jadinii (strain ATCC 18201 / CBS 1600 / BCRC 20928 / JCM 3617 / NBRC 0987 / NRRL Y-1542) TaxID=983966 RepID=A0A1E4S9U9_CYBJN|nr:mitochondrial carrier [Cyberlindnera jadinii NRRL Y-1542]ODV76152.1 mitochondrial carrier [Cyberlindnera jadinii NRRL Y-1542]